MEPVYRPVIAAALSLFAAQGTRFTITGAENIPATGGAVIAMNHISYLDYAYAGVPAWKTRRRYIRFMAKREIFAAPGVGALMRGMGHIEVDREAGAASYRTAVEALRDGELVGVFPEATISRSFELKSFKLGAARMAIEAGVPLIPVITWGGQRIATKGLPRRMGRTNVPVSISVGTPMTVSSGESAAEVTARLKKTMSAMLDTVRSAYPMLSGQDARFVPASLGGAAPTLAQADDLDAADRAARVARRRSRGQGGTGS